MKRPYKALVAAAVLAAFACSEELTVPSAEPAVLHLPQLLVSNTVVSSAVAGAGGSVSSAAVAGGADVTYVSLPPGTLPEMVSVRIRNSDTGEATPSIPMAEGGFDPVAVAASEGHELEFTFTDGEGAVSVAHATVPDRRPPVVVRTNPPRGRTDVVLSILPVVVFSEPIDPETLAAGARLLGPTGAEVEALVRLRPNEPWTAELVPASALEPEATYELVVSTEVRDLDGDALAEPVTVTFTTEDVLWAPADVAITLEPDSVTVVVGADAQLTVTVRRDGKDITQLAFVRFISEDADIATVDHERGLVTGVVAGTTNVISFTLADGWPVPFPWPADTTSVTVVNPGS